MYRADSGWSGVRNPSGGGKRGAEETGWDAKSYYRLAGHDDDSGDESEADAVSLAQSHRCVSRGVLWEDRSGLVKAATVLRKFGWPTISLALAEGLSGCDPSNLELTRSAHVVEILYVEDEAGLLNFTYRHCDCCFRLLHCRVIGLSFQQVRSLK